MSVLDSLTESMEGLSYVLDEIDGCVNTLTGTQQIVAIDRIRKQLENSLNSLNETRSKVQEQLLTIWEADGTTKTTVDGRTVYIECQRWAKPKNGNRQAVVKVLELLGMEEFVNFNTQSLSSYVRNAPKEGYDIPPELDAVIEVSDVYKIKSRGK